MCQSRRERLSLASVGFFTAVAVVRGLTIAIHNNMDPFHDVSMGGRHIHHLRDVYWEREGRESFEALAFFGGIPRSDCSGIPFSAES